MRILYGAQTGIAPPAFVLFTNVATELHFSYERYLVNRLRESFGFEGTPIRLTVRRRGGDRSRAARAVGRQLNALRLWSANCPRRAAGLWAAECADQFSLCYTLRVLLVVTTAAIPNRSVFRAQEVCEHRRGPAVRPAQLGGGVS